jgi:hypothetical protein
MTGDLPWPIGDPISDKIGGIPSGYETNSVACLYKNRYYLSYTGANQTANSGTLVWDVKHGSRLLRQGLTGAWTTMDWAANDMQAWEGTLYTLDNANKYIMEHDFSGADDYYSKTGYDAATKYSISNEISTGILYFGQEWAEKLVNSLSIIARSTGTTVNAAVSFNDGEFSRTKLFTLGTGSYTADPTGLVWGEGTWGDFNWASVGLGGSTGDYQSDHKKLGKGGKGRNCQLTLTSADTQDTRTIVVKLYYKVLPAPA